ncbi:DoxX family protein [Emticicia sp. 17c]|uniref:DoxX family protein n=1 Tax=Emticicia sp. 17c TaxID=3127704 RepID=UPI00301D8AFA
MQQINNTGFALIRIITGLLMGYHGLEIFESAKMQEYASWDSIKDMPFPLLLAYLGKGSELVGGLLLAFGWQTRIAGVLIGVTMFFICFKIGSGKFWYEDQHPFLFALLGMIYFFAGPGKWSIDGIKRQKTF